MEGKMVKKINIRQLKKLINETPISPSVADQKPKDSALESKNTKNALMNIKRGFRQALETNLVISAMADFYDTQTHDLDDNTYKMIQKICDVTTDRIDEVVKKAMEAMWKQGHDIFDSYKTKKSKKAV